MVKLRSVKIVAILFMLLPLWAANESPTRPTEKDGRLAMFVTWGDLQSTPANDVYIEAHGFVVKYHSQKSFILKMSKAGHYEGALPSGVYDVFVSEGTSKPVCRRLLIKPDSTTEWNLQLEIDEVYTEK